MLFPFAFTRTVRALRDFANPFDLAALAPSNGRPFMFTEGQLTDGEGKVLAKATSTISLVPNRV